MWSLILNRIAAVAGPSAYHFARQFKAATGLPPHRYVIGRRVERAKPLLQVGPHLIGAKEVEINMEPSSGPVQRSDFSQYLQAQYGVDSLLVSLAATSVSTVNAGVSAAAAAAAVRVA